MCEGGGAVSLLPRGAVRQQLGGGRVQGGGRGGGRGGGGGGSAEERRDTLTKDLLGVDTLQVLSAK